MASKRRGRGKTHGKKTREAHPKKKIESSRKAASSSHTQKSKKHKAVSQKRKAASTNRKAASRKAWQTRKTNPRSLLRSMTRALANYQSQGHKKTHYSRFRMVKRWAYKNLDEKDAFLLSQNAARQAGWEEQYAVKFAKFS